MLIEVAVLLLGIGAVLWGPRLGGGIILIGALLYLASKAAMIFFLNKNARHLVNLDLTLGPRDDGTYRYESTAGTGVVPKWVSLAGLVSTGIVIIGLLISLVSLFSW